MNIRVILVGSALAGWTVLTFLDGATKAGLLLVLAALVVVCMRRSSAARRHLVWLCALTGAFLLPFSFRLVPQWRVLPSWMRWEEAPSLLIGKRVSEQPVVSDAELGQILNIEEITDPMVEDPSSAATLAKRVQLAEPSIFRLPVKWLILGWLVGAAGLTFPLIFSGWVLRRKASGGRRVVAGRLFETFQDLKSELGMNREVVLLIGNESQMPMVWGVLRQYLLLPEGAQDWPMQRIRPVLLHELSHLRRNDPASLWIGHLAQAVHWFNPFAWWAIRQLRIEQENACDDAVLRHGVLSSDYAGQVLEVCASFQSGAVPSLALSMARNSGIEGRIAGILDPSRNRRSTTRRLVLACSSIAVFAAGALAMLRAGEAEATVRGRILDRNGLILAESSATEIRKYPHGATAAHQLGTIFENKKEGRGYLGRSGAELAYNPSLLKGEAVSIALDLGIQQAVESAMRNAEVARGAAVVLDCSNGDVVASASFPSFNPQAFVPVMGQEDWNELNTNPGNPMMDRATTRFTPGSTFVLLNALAACRTGKGGEIFECNGPVTIGESKIACWIHNMHGGKHGSLDLRGGISKSCNCYHTQLAVRAGIKELDIAAEVLGLDKISAQMEDPAKVSPVETAFIAIGQGRVAASPMQLAGVAAAIGNGGKVWLPRMAIHQAPQLRADLVKLGWKQEDLAMIRNGMDDCVNSPGGTGGAARSELVRICGKTGTALTTDQGKPSTNAWFVGYAPAENPRYAIAVMVKDGNSGGRICGPIARDILEHACNATK